MKLQIERKYNDQLVNNGVQSVDRYDVDNSGKPMTFSPELLNLEMIGWEWQESKYDVDTDTLIIYVHDMCIPEDYL